MERPRRALLAPSPPRSGRQHVDPSTIHKTFARPIPPNPLPLIDIDPPCPLRNWSLTITDGPDPPMVGFRGRREPASRKSPSPAAFLCLHEKVVGLHAPCIHGGGGGRGRRVRCVAEVRLLLPPVEEEESRQVCSAALPAFFPFCFCVVCANQQMASTASHAAFMNSLLFQPSFPTLNYQGPARRGG